MKLAYILLLSAFLACNNTSENSLFSDSSKEINMPFHNADTSTRDYSELLYNLPQSHYYYQIRITGIEIKVVKKAFETRTGKYDVPKILDGYRLTINFSETNPYDEEMMADVPGYYYIASEGKGKITASNTASHKGCACEIENSTEVTDIKGTHLWKLNKGKCGSYSGACMLFKSKETKHFKINFTEPLFGNVDRIVFWGFDQKWENPHYTTEKDKGLVIDIKQKKVIGEHYFTSEL